MTDEAMTESNRMYTANTTVKKSASVGDSTPSAAEEHVPKTSTAMAEPHFLLRGAVCWLNVAIACVYHSANPHADTNESE